MTETTDFLIVGGGVLGLRLAVEAKERHPDAEVVLLEKERRCGLHASGRNSGVLHAGFYYATDSLKARFTREGNRRLTEYCLERDLPINRCGKLVVARSADELPGLERLLSRAEANGVEMERVSESEAREIEPRARTHGEALWSPSTSTVDPGAVVAAFHDEAVGLGVDVRTGTAYRGLEPAGGTGRGTGAAPSRVRIDDGILEAGYLINAAGLYADRVARDFGFSRRYRLLPFKGLYLHSSEGEDAFRTNIYPVPDLDKPFLGVHFTLTVDGRAKIGPTATPAFWREHYEGLENFDLREFLQVIGREIGLFLRDEFGFRSLAVEELMKHYRPRLVRLASELARGVRPEDYRRWGIPGIRAQLLDIEEKKLVMDFKHQGDDRSFHVLNGISPGFTCSLPFAEHCFDRIEELAG